MSDLRITVSGIRNRTHVFYVVSWIRHALGGAGSGASATVVQTNCAGRLTDEAQRPDGLLRGLPVRLVDAHPAGSGQHQFVSIGAPAIKTWARLRLRPSAWPLHTVVVDEGIGSYGSIATRRAAMRREGSSEPWLTTRSLAVTVSRRVLPDEEWRLYHPVDGTWALDERVASEFRQQVSAPTRSHRLVVFLTQPWVEYDLVTSDRYVGHLQAVERQVRAAGMEFAVRPHQTEDVGRYESFRLMTSALPAELDAEVVSAAYVLGETSTALLNLAAVHGVPAARVDGPMNGIAEIELSRAQQELFQRFVRRQVAVAEIRSLLCP